jgi:hypothetical protein
MQKGTVLYLADAKTLPPDWEPGRDLAAAGLDPTWTEVAAPAAGFCSPQEAQLRLATRGAGHIDGVSARYADGELQLSSARMRLWR